MIKRVVKKIWAFVLALSMVLGLAAVNTEVAYADGWLNHVQNYTLGETVTGTLNTSDYYGDSWYWDVYKFDMPVSGNLMCYVESKDLGYFSNYGYAIYSSSNLTQALWNAYSGFTIYDNYDNSRGIYYGSKQVFLSSGTYYFMIRNSYTRTTPYSLKLSIGVSSITVTPSELTLGVGETAQLTATVAPDNAADKTVYWSSSDGDVASVSTSGLVTAVKKGTATITAKDVSGEVTASCEVTVAEDISGAQITNLQNYVYDGSAKKSEPTVTLNGKTLSSGSDYTLSYANNINAGTATVTVTGKGTYTGSVSAAFNIAKASNPIYVQYTSISKYRYYLTKKTKYNLKASAFGTLKYSVNKKAKKAKIKVSKKGVITIPKWCKKGTYKVIVKASGDANHYANKGVIKIYIR